MIQGTRQGEGTYEVSPVTGSLNAAAAYRIEDGASPFAPYRRTPCTIIDLEEENPAFSHEDQASYRLIIESGEAAPPGCFVLNAPKKSGAGAVYGSSFAGDTGKSILAGCGVLVVILLLAVLITIAPLAGGSGAAAGFTAPAAVGLPGSATGLPANTTDRASSSADPAPVSGVSAASAAPAPATLGIIPADTPLPRPVTDQPSSSEPHVTLQAVPSEPTSAVRDIREDLPVPDTSDLYTIYSMNGQQAQQNIPSVIFEVKNPPLVIDYTITPMNITEVKSLDYKVMATRHHENLSISRPYEQSWFSVVVRDTADGTVVAEDGYGKGYPEEPSRHLVVYTSGTYRVEFSGGFALVNLTMNVKKEGNIP